MSARQPLFISHATPEDNAFTIWLDMHHEEAVWSQVLSCNVHPSIRLQSGGRSKSRPAASSKDRYRVADDAQESTPSSVSRSFRLESEWSPNDRSQFPGWFAER